MDLDYLFLQLFLIGWPFELSREDYEPFAILGVEMSVHWVQTTFWPYGDGGIWGLYNSHH